MNVPNDNNSASFQAPQPSSAVPGIRRRFPQPEEESLKNILRILRRRKSYILWFTLGGLSLALAACIFLSSQYKATATLLVDKQNSSGLDMSSLSSLAAAVGGSDDLQVDLQTQATVLSSNTTMLKVVDELGLQNIPPYSVRPGLFGLNARLKSELGLPLEKAPATRERILNKMSSRLEVTPLENTRLITVTFRDHDPQRAADIANTFVTTYIQEYLQTKFKATAQASDWLTGQLNSLQKHVEDSQAKLSSFEQKTGLSILMLGMGSESSGSGAGGGVTTTHIPAVDKLAALNEELTAAEGDRITKEAIYRLTQTENPDVVLGMGSISLSTATSSVFSQGNGLAALEALRAQKTELQTQIADATTKYGEKNPHLVGLQGQMAALDSAIREEMARVRDRAKNDYEVAKQTESGIQQSYDAQEAEVNKLNDSTVELELLAGEAASSRILYNNLYSMLQEASIQAGVSATNLSLVDPARAPATTFIPNWLLYPLGGFAAGLLLGIMAAFIRERLDDSIVTPDQVESETALPLLSYIPLARDEPGDKQSGGAPVRLWNLLLERPRAPIAEAYRSLRTSILLSTADAPIRTLLVTSPTPGDGKSFTAFNVGVAFAQSGTSTVIVDADMRKPTLHSFFGMPQKPGLAEVLSGMISIDNALKQHPKLDQLHFLPAGSQPPDPSVLVGSRRMEALLEELRSKFSLVIVDTPPVLLVTDAVVLCGKVDGTVVVIRSGKTSRQALKQSSETLLRSPGRKLGIIVNGLDTKSADYYYTYGFYGDSKYYGREV